MYNSIKKHKEIKMLFLDVDGTLTDGKIHISESGELFKSFNIKDGLGIHDILSSKGIIPVIITGRNSKMLELRCKEIGIKAIYQGIQDKKPFMRQIIYDNGCKEEECAYIGDDINDYECMQLVKYRGCPKDAVGEIINICDFVSTKCGGDGAVREFIEWL